MIVGQIGKIHTQFFQYFHPLRFCPECILLSFHGHSAVRHTEFQIDTGQICLLHSTDQLRIDTVINSIFLLLIIFHGTPVICQINISGKRNCKIIGMKIRCFHLFFCSGFLFCLLPFICLFGFYCFLTDFRFLLNSPAGCPDTHTCQQEHCQQHFPSAHLLHLLQNRNHLA